MDEVDFEREFESAMKNKLGFVTVTIEGGTFVYADRYEIIPMSGGVYVDLYYLNRIVGGAFLDNVVTVHPWRYQYE